MNQRRYVPLEHHTERRQLHSTDASSAPHGAYLIEVPHVGAFLSRLLPNCAPVLGDNALFYAIVDDFGSLVAVK